MWWLTIPVIIYSAGIFVLWVILRRYSGTDTRGGDILPGFTGEVATPGGQENINLLSENGPGVTLGAASAFREQYSTPLPEHGTKVTVVVAVRNEQRTVTTLLDCMVRQDYPADLLEIIIVNDNSTDRTPVAVSEFMEAHRESSGISMRLLFNPFHGKKQAIRLGVSRSSGELILTTDADCTAGPGWIRAHVAEYERGRKGNLITHNISGRGQGSVDAGRQPSSSGAAPSMVLAPVVQKHTSGFWSRFGVYEFSALQSVTEATALAGHPVMCNGANMSFARDVYLRHAGELLDELPSGDDIFLLDAVRRGGGAVGFAGSSAATVETAAAVTAAALLRQRARWASKGWYYRDPATLTLAAATAACNAAVTATAVGAAISAQYLPLLGALYAIRAVPDYLIIARNIKKSGGKIPLVPFVLSELIYPFWFITVAVKSIFPDARRFQVK
jgi:cellulose synthase/poly-beta-1,6-N-acetylglucosamine synthase-like glycosyltransferase